MKYFTLVSILLALNINLSCASWAQSSDNAGKESWISLFNGKNLDGWKAGDNAETFSVEDGLLKVAGQRSHIYYTGDVENHDFQNFEFEATVMTKQGANSGIYFHTRYQDSGWPLHGYEVQINNSGGDWKRTGSLYDIVEVRENYAQDDEWFTEYIKVDGNRVIVKVNDIVTVDYTQPENPKREGERVNRILKGGTFAIQAHDPGSVIYFKEIKVRPLP